MFRVLWVDDQHHEDEMQSFIIEAENNGFYLDGYASFEEGFQALEQNLELYDIILLDGMFFESKDQEKGSEDEIGLGMAIAKINEIKNRKIFPWFVLSGKDTFTKGGNPILKANKINCFDKTNPKDIVRLFEEMKSAADKHSDVQLKHRYSRLLTVCENKYLGSDYFKRLLSLIKHIENSEQLSSTEDMLNPIRKILERMFISLGEKGLIPKAILPPNKGWINGSCSFLSNKHKDYEHLEEFVPPIVGENIYRLLNITQDASHGEGELRLRVDQYLKNAPSDYLYRSSVYLLFDILLWYKDFMDNHRDKAVNQTLWKITIDYSDWLKGSVSRIAPNGWGTFQPESNGSAISILPQMVQDFSLSENDKIRVLTEPSSDGIKIHIKQLIKESPSTP